DAAGESEHSPVSAHRRADDPIQPSEETTAKQSPVTGNARNESRRESRIGVGEAIEPSESGAGRQSPTHPPSRACTGNEGSELHVTCTPDGAPSPARANDIRPIQDRSELIAQPVSPGPTHS